MTKRRRILSPPRKNAPGLVHAIWRASGPGRVWGLREWARSEGKEGGPYRDLAQRTLEAADAIGRWYAKGATKYATLKLERLASELGAASKERRRERRRMSASGGTSSGKTRKEAAGTWQAKIRARVERLLASGWTESNIARRLAADAGRSAETVRKFAAKVHAKK